MGTILLPLILIHKFQHLLNKVELRAWLSMENEFTFLWERPMKYFRQSLESLGNAEKAILMWLHKDIKSPVDVNMIINRFFPFILEVE